eukprot:Skav216728  [mRNA]  locus=scaffold653:98995:99897:+ [translate_table: standard]
MIRCSTEQNEDCVWDASLFVLWNFTLIWIQILCTASWEFAVAYLAAEWYMEGGPYAENRENGLIQCCSVWWALFRYHFGTMVKASVFIGIVRPVRFLLRRLTAVARMENPVGGIILCCCGCLVEVYEEHLEWLSANAYIEVALSGLDLDQAVSEASKVSACQKDKASQLNRTTFIFRFIGLVLIWWAGCFIMWMVVSGSFPGLGEYGNVDSPHFVGHRDFWSNAGGIIACAAAFPAMMVFDMASDTIQYCSTVDQLQESKVTAVEKFMGLVSETLNDAIGDLVSLVSSSDSDRSDTSSSS